MVFELDIVLGAILQQVVISALLIFSGGREASTGSIVESLQAVGLSRSLLSSSRIFLRRKKVAWGSACHVMNCALDRGCDTQCFRRCKQIPFRPGDSGNILG